jgi:hypothetical protein
MIKLICGSAIQIYFVPANKTKMFCFLPKDWHLMQALPIFGL